MFRFSTIFLVLCIATVVCSSPLCQPNSVYSECASICPITCDNYQNPPKFCANICEQGCVCNDGYVLNSDGMCVHPCHC